MKNLGLFITTLGLCALILTGCNCEKGESEVDARLQQAMDYCLEHGGTHSLIHSPTAVYGECMFPSGIGCEDDIVLNGECNYTPNTESIDTEEKRLAGCEENVQGWIDNFLEGAENTNIEWEDESEAGASFVRNGAIKYTKDGSNRRLDVECVADFVDGSIGITYGDEVSDEVSEEVVEEAADETAE